LLVFRPFFSWKLFCMDRNHIFQFKFWQILISRIIIVMILFYFLILQLGKFWWIFPVVKQNICPICSLKIFPKLPKNLDVRWPKILPKNRKLYVN
jgi:hypothetical protein